MAVAIANTQTIEQTTSGTVRTALNYTPAAGSNRILVVTVSALMNSEVTFPVSSVTFGGVSLTEAVTQRTQSTSRAYRSAIWYLINPSSSAGNIVVTMANNCVSSVIGASTLTGAAQTDPILETDSDSTSTTIKLSLLTNLSTHSGHLALFNIAASCLNNPTWNNNDETTTELYDIRTANNTNLEAAAWAAYTVGVAGDEEYVTDHYEYHYYITCNVAFSHVGVVAVFKEAATTGMPIAIAQYHYRRNRRQANPFATI